MKPTCRILTFFCLVGLPLIANAQTRITVRRLKPDSGTVLSVTNGSITIKNSKDKEQTYKIQTGRKDPLTIEGVTFNVPARIKVAGELTTDALRDGSLVVFKANIAKGGRVEAPVTRMKWLVDDPPKPSIKPSDATQTSKFKECDVAGFLHSIREDRMTVSVPKSPQAPRGKLNVKIHAKAVVDITSTSLDLVEPGDVIDKFTPLRFSNGDMGIESIQITLKDSSAERKSSIDDELNAKHADKSDEPSPPREVRSQHFLLTTDISDRQAAVLLEKLERMILLVSKYFGRPPRGVIRGFVVRDIKQFPVDQLDPNGAAKIANGEGLTVSRSLGRQRNSIVYSCDKHQVVQHEAVHAYCFQTFGSTGPTWYSEGLAEMGSYWREGEREVNIDTPVIDYLTRSEPKKLLDIVKAGQITGDSWQAYAWRWALCHLLAGNPNYEKRFKILGMAMMSGERATFESTFGDISREISFEYDQFVKNFGNGYRADLCAWQWKPAKPLPKKRKLKRTIKADAGWQATQIRLKSGVAYDVASKGQWQTNPAEEKVDGDGANDGKGKLIGVILTDEFTLSEEIPLGKRKKFTASAEGHLYVRCKDEWTQIDDNSGQLDVYIRVSPE
ncbi:MAG: hypothetical protein AAF497_10955 [Planctomycetota bacterium]